MRPAKGLTRALWIGIAVAPALGILAAIWAYGVNVPWMDDWMAIGAMFEKMSLGTLGFLDVTSQHNEHRIFFPKLICLALGSWGGWDVRRETIVTFLMAALTAWNVHRLLKEGVPVARTAAASLSPLSPRALRSADHELAVHRIGSVVDVLVAAQLAHGPTQRARDDLRSAGVPFLQLLAVDVEIGFAEEQQAHFVAHAPRVDELRSERIGEALRPGRRVASRHGDPRRLAGRTVALREPVLPTLGGSLDSRALAAGQTHAPQRRTLGRQGHRPERAASVDRERDVHRPVVAHLAVLARSVERIDDPHTGLREPLARVGGLLREDPVVRVAPADEALEVSVGGLIPDVGERFAAPAPGRPDRECALAGRACGGDRELEVGSDLGRTGRRHVNDSKGPLASLAWTGSDDTR